MTVARLSVEDDYNLDQIICTPDSEFFLADSEDDYGRRRGIAIYISIDAPKNDLI